MFKKPKNITPPAAPALEDVLSDIETFQVDVEHRNKTVEFSETSMEGWWTVFEQFIEDLKCLEMVHSEIEGFQIKLESLKLEIGNESTLLKNQIDKHLELIDTELG